QGRFAAPRPRPRAGSGRRSLTRPPTGTERDVSHAIRVSRGLCLDHRPLRLGNASLLMSARHVALNFERTNVGHSPAPLSLGGTCVTLDALDLTSARDSTTPKGRTAPSGWKP